MKHWIIAANIRHDVSLEALKKMYRDGSGLVSKEDLAVAAALRLRTNQAAVDATKSPQRIEVEQVLIDE